MKTNKGGWQVLISVAMILIVVSIAAFSAGVLSEQKSANKSINIHRQDIVRLRECNASLTMQLKDTKNEVEFWRHNYGWVAKTIQEKGVEK